MKNKKMILRTGIFYLYILTLISCNKTEEVIIGQKSEPRTFPYGTIAREDPERLDQIPLIVSDNYLMQAARISQNNLKGSTKKDTKPPVVSIASPLSGAAVSGIIAVNVNATDNIAVAEVSVIIDGTLVASKTAAPYSFSWNTTSSASGTHTIKAIAKDLAGNSSSYSVQVTVGNSGTTDITGPDVSIISPTSGTSVNAGSVLSISVSATDMSGVAFVELSLDGSLLSRLTASPYIYSLNTTGLSAGAHTLTATARDNYGNMTSRSVSLNINAVINNTNLPSAYQLSMPPVQNQGGEGICGVFSTVYATASAEKYYRANASSYNYATNIFSPEFVFNSMVQGNCSGGLGIMSILEFIKTTGVCSWQSMPYSEWNGCSTLPNSTQLAEAAGNRIYGYSRINIADITAIKTMIIQKHPAIVTFRFDQSFSSAGPGFIWRTAGALSIDHSVAICGYDDAKHAYKIINSWGTAWGDAGYSWIDYDLLPQVSYAYAYVINQ